MAFSHQNSLYGLLFSSTLIVSSFATPSVPVAYCASINTGTTPTNTSIYQSDGLCYNFCIDDYAFAVVQGQDCWCSDYTPSKTDQVSTSECDTPCPGWSPDVCGGDSLYGYMALNKSPSGTAGGSSSASPTTTSKTSAVTTPTVQTVTAGGVVQTVTVTPSSGAGDNSSVSSTHKGLSAGAAAGIAIGVVAIFVFAGVIAFLVWRRKRQQKEPEDALFVANNPKTPSPRGTSPNTSSSPKVSEVSTAPAFARKAGDGQWENDQSGRRRSTLMPIDPRIDPAFSGIYARTDNKSRDSVNSLRDDHDYSRRVHQPGRVLRATNPDPDEEQ
ncbi:Cell wall integrity and stress response component 4 [Sporothrix curviconia]|uniref:Cell wall integrity and stress response component 4 n=1 Tax=Sporothrix curviconia TaxID=1260050 RepID=A0ABP0CUY2_9PEZI